MKKIILFGLVCIIVVTCTPMDENFKKFIENGPIVYLTRLDEQELQVVGERNRINFRWPAQTDPRGKKARIYWSSRTEMFEQDINPLVPTSFFVGPLNEGSYIFEIFIIDEFGNASVPVTVSGFAYGDSYESYLIDWKIMRTEIIDNTKKVVFARPNDPNMTGMEFEWRNRQNNLIETFVAATDSTIIHDCTALLFRHRTQYVPEGGIDKFHTPWQYYIGSVDPENVDYDIETNTVTFPQIDDANFVRNEIHWIDRFDQQPRSLTTTGNTLTLNDYNAIAFNYHAVLSVDGSEVSTTVNRKATVVLVETIRINEFYLSLQNGEQHQLEVTEILPVSATIKEVEWSSSDTQVAEVDNNGVVTARGPGQAVITAEATDGGDVIEICNVDVGFVDLDRTNWFAEPERNTDTGAALANVAAVGAPPGVNVNSPASTITNKIKSPYLSHFLPHSGATAFSLTGNDGLNNASAHFDDDSRTYLMFVKGLGGEGEQNGTIHLLGGVIIPPSDVGDKPWFIIRLDPAAPQRFNYFRLRYRESSPIPNRQLKPREITMFGSNDDDCITDDSKWVRINDTRIELPNSDMQTNYNASLIPNEPGIFNNVRNYNIETGNVMLPQINEYRYVKVLIEKWWTGDMWPSTPGANPTLQEGNTFQIAEFWLGLCQ